MTSEGSLQPQRGPCATCGDVGYPLSAGGPRICPACDSQPPEKRVRQLADENRELRKLIIQLPGGRETLVEWISQHSKVRLKALSTTMEQNTQKR